MRNFSSEKMISKFFSFTLIFSLVFISQQGLASFYHERPDILKVEPIDHIKGSKNTLTEWANASYGHYVLLAELLTFFPDSEFYFLARDIEYLHDMAKVLLKNDPVLKKRLHLIPISTNIVGDEENMRKYLEQEGLTKQNLGQRSAVIVDSCCTGSVPDAIINAFVGKKVDIKGFLITTSVYPNSALAKNLGADGGQIEELPHYNHPATEYVEKSKKIRIETGAAPNERPTALKIMQQIRFDEDNAKSRKEFFELLELMRTVYSYMAEDMPYKKSTPQQADNALRKMHEKFDIEPSVFLEDVKNMSRKSYADINIQRVQNVFQTKASNADIHQLVQNLALDPTIDISEKINNFPNVELKDILVKAVEFLNYSSAETLSLTEEEYKKLARQWVREVNDNPNYAQYSHEVAIPLSDLILKTNDAKKAIEYLAQNYKGASEKQVARIIIAAIAADDYKYFGSSAIRKVISQFKMLSSSPEIFKAVMQDFIKNAKPQDIMKVTEKILEHLDAFPYAYGDFELLGSTLKKLITSSPKISAEMVKQILASSYSRRGVHSTGFKDPALPFLKWFFSQTSRFAIEAKGVRLNWQQAQFISNTQWHEDPTIADFLKSQPKPKAKLCAISTRKK